MAKYNPDSWPAVWVLQLIANGNLHSFYTSREWKRLRREVLKHQRRRCWDCAHKAPAVNKRGVTVHHNQRMLHILREMGLTTATCRPPETDGSGDLG